MLLAVVVRSFIRPPLRSVFLSVMCVCLSATNTKWAPTKISTVWLHRSTDSCFPHSLIHKYLQSTMIGYIVLTRIYIGTVVAL